MRPTVSNRLKVSNLPEIVMYRELNELIFLVKYRITRVNVEKVLLCISWIHGID